MKEHLAKIGDAIRLLPQSMSARRSNNPVVQRALEEQALRSQLEAADVHLPDGELNQLLGRK